MDELQTLEQLLQELLNGIQDVIQSGEVLTDEFQGLLAQELTYLTDRIDQIRSEIPSIPTLDKAPFDSSVINAFKYNPKTQELFVKFQDKFPLENGPQYVYKGVPMFIFDLFRKGGVAPKTSGSNAWHTWKQGVAPSLGASLNALLKQGGYPYQRLT